MTQRSRDRNSVTTLAGRDPMAGVSRTAALAAVGPALYAVRLDGLVKIGFSTNLARRLVTLRHSNGGTEVELLGFQPGARDDETKIHAQLAGHRARGREYYQSHALVVATGPR